MGIINGKWVCSAHLNDRFRSKQTFQELIDLIRDYNASVVIQMRANAIEKGISMSKRWGVMKNLEDHNPKRKQPTEIEVANDVFKYSKGTVEYHELYPPNLGCNPLWRPVSFQVFVSPSDHQHVPPKLQLEQY